MANNYTGDRTAVVFHNENAVIAEIVGQFRAMLTAAGYEDWNVMRANQPTVQALENKTIYIDIISKRRFGVQSNRSFKDSQGWYEAGTWYEDWLIQVSGFQQRNPQSDTATTVTSTDVITVLQAYVNGFNASDTRWFNQPWMNLIRSTDVREIDFDTDSGLKEKFPQFDFTLVIEQGLLKTNARIDTIELDIKRV